VHCGFKKDPLDPFKKNSWLFVVPVPDHLTVICSEQNPSDLEIKDNGMLTFLSEYLGCGDKIMTRSVTAHCINHTEKDIFPPVELQLDCSESVTNKIEMNFS
jgi:hypothetical protein